MKVINRWTADVLSSLRFGCTCVSAFLVVVGFPTVALVMFGVTVITDPVEGAVARRVPDTLRPGHSGKWMSNAASGTLLALMPLAITVRFFLAHMLNWPDASTAMMWIWLAGCAMFALLAGHLNFSKMYLRPEAARNADLHQGWLFFAVLFACTIQLCATAFGTRWHAWVIAGFIAVIVEIVSLAYMWERPFPPDCYHGTRTRKDLYTGQS